MDPNRSPFRVLRSQFVFRFGSRFRFEVRGSSRGKDLKNCVLRGNRDVDRLRTSPGVRRIPAAFEPARAMPRIGKMGKGVRRFENLRAWQACNAYKKAIYPLCEQPPLSDDWKRRDQLEGSVRGPCAHIAEGFGRFNPPDNARFVVMARASLMESQNHLGDLVDHGYITETQRVALNALAEVALQETTGWLEYLQSPEALRNARRARERRIATRNARRSRTSNSEPEPEPEHEPRRENSEE